MPLYEVVVRVRRKKECGALWQYMHFVYADEPVKGEAEIFSLWRSQYGHIWDLFAIISWEEVGQNEYSTN